MFSSHSIVITGPTGSGKTDLAIDLARRFNLPVANADPYQFYREIPVLSNQPNCDDVSFRFLNDRSMTHPVSAGEFAREVDSSGLKSCIWVGTGLYLGAALYGLDEDRRKGTPFQGAPKQAFRAIVLDIDRKSLYERLDQRVDLMLTAGAVEEAQKVAEGILQGKWTSQNPVTKAIGLKHLLQYIEGQMSLDESIALWKRDTRRLAKRQWTWLRKFFRPSENILWIHEIPGPETLDEFVCPKRGDFIKISGWNKA